MVRWVEEVVLTTSEFVVPSPVTLTHDQTHPDPPRYVTWHAESLILGQQRPPHQVNIGCSSSPRRER